MGSGVTECLMLGEFEEVGRSWGGHERMCSAHLEEMRFLVMAWLTSLCWLDVAGRGYEYVLEPSPVPLPLDRPQETRVLQVACGRAHSLVLTDKEGGELICGCVQGTQEQQGPCLCLGPS